jgi:hypothetical protein
MLDGEEKRYPKRAIEVKKVLCGLMTREDKSWKD